MPELLNISAFSFQYATKTLDVPADYFIIVKEGKAMLFFNQDRSPLSLAGVYDFWKPFIKAKESTQVFQFLHFLP